MRTTNSHLSLADRLLGARVQGSLPDQAAPRRPGLNQMDVKLALQLFVLPALLGAALGLIIAASSGNSPAPEPDQGLSAHSHSYSNQSWGETPAGTTSEIVLPPLQLPPAPAEIWRDYRQSIEDVIRSNYKAPGSDADPNSSCSAEIVIDRQGNVTGIALQSDTSDAMRNAIQRSLTLSSPVAPPPASESRQCIMTVTFDHGTVTVE